MLKNKICLVTGAASGLGRETVKMLVREKAIVIAIDVNEKLLGQLKTETESEGGEIRIWKADITDRAVMDQICAETVREFKRIDVLINNAGIDYTKPVTELEFGQFEKVVGVNLIAPFILSKLVWPHMKKQGGGYIVNIASTAAKRAWPNASAYHASKWGLVGLSHALLTEGRGDGIKVSVLILGGMRTPFILDRFPDTPLSVLHDPANVAQAIRFVLEQKEETAIPELMIMPVKETSWP